MSLRIALSKGRSSGGSAWNHRSKEVTALRKGGQLEAAYSLSLERIADLEADDYDRAAYAWCLIALVKKHSADGNRPMLSEYLEKLGRFKVPANDDMLREHREKALNLADPDRRAVLNARNLSRQGKHEEAARIYADIHANGKLQPEDRKSWGWELYRLIKAELEGKRDEELAFPTVQRVKRHLNTYLNLAIGGPDLLHSLMLRQGLRLTKADHLKLLPFIRLWNPDHFADEDFTRQTGKDGKTYPSLVEQVIQTAAAEAANNDRTDDRQFILPHVKAAMKRFPDSIWLKLNAAKLLRGLGRIDEAQTLAIEFAREKASEYWAWELIGDLVSNDIDLKRACYAKALSCSQNDDFVGKVRLKLAALLEESHPAEARFEVERTMKHRALAGYQITREAQALSERLAGVVPKPTDRTFYVGLAGKAEELLFSHIPWTDASLGSVFSIDGRDGQKPRRRRRIYLKANMRANELSLPENHADIRGLPDGAPLKVQYETSKAEPWRATIHRISSRPEGAPMDAVPELIGVVDHVNPEREVLHVIVARDVDGTCPISALKCKAKTGMFVKVRLSKYKSRNSERNRILEIAPSEESPAPQVCRRFQELVEVTDRGLGFTPESIFIPPQLVSQSEIESGDSVEGLAVISYDKKRRKWGWKAIEVKCTDRAARFDV